jgi:outer membrane protein assembly factor BamB
VSVKSTFEESYTEKLKVTPTQNAVISPNNDALIIVGQPSSLVNKQHTAISRINAQNGVTLWGDRVHRIGNIVNTPSNVIVIEEENIALVFGYTTGSLMIPARYQISAIDLVNKKQLWNREERGGSGYADNGFYLPKNKSLIITTPDGMQSFDIRTGKIIWDINDLSLNVNFRTTSFRLLRSSGVNFIYLEDMDGFLMQANGKVYFLNPYTGKAEWEQSNLGNIEHADLFENEGFAVFYGPRGQEQAQNITNSRNRALNVASRAISSTSSGLTLNPIHVLDLKTGKLRWSNDYHTNGQSKVILVEDKLLVTGLVTYTFDIKTGKKLWQTVPGSELNKEGIFSLFAEFTGFDLSAGGKTTKDAQVIGNSVFVVFPELFENRTRRNQVSIRLYDFEKEELVWKTEPMQLEIRDFFFQSGVVFIKVNGRFSKSSKLIALDPYTGETMYEIETREPLNNLVFTEELIFHTNFNGSLSVYQLRNGETVQLGKLPGAVIDLVDMGNEMMVVTSNRGKVQLAFHDRNTFNRTKDMELPFYSKNFETINNNLFIRIDQEKHKGIAHVDLDRMKLIDYISISTNGTKSVEGKSGNIILDPYHLIIDAEAKYLYGIKKKKITRYKIKTVKTN